MTQERTELITRLEGLTEPCRVCDALIYKLINKRQISDTTYVGGPKGGTREVVYKIGRRPLFSIYPFFTSSIDSALTLVPKYWEWTIDNCYCSSEGEVIYTASFGQLPDVEHRCLAIAICIASLKEREHE